MNAKVLSGLNVIAFIGVLTVNALANILPINGYNTGQISDFYPSLFTPAGFTFSIWSVIYLLLLAFVLFQFSLRAKPYYTELSLWFLLSCIANASWILAWHYLLTWASVAIMLVLLYSLIKIFLLLQQQGTLSWPARLWLKLPFVFYLSWICVATIANVSALLVSLQWESSFLQPATWTIIMTVIASALALFISIRFQEPSFLLVVIWALFGIYSKQLRGSFAEIAFAAQWQMIVLTLAFLYITLQVMKKGPASR